MGEDRLSSIVGCLLGMAIGDALGLPVEGLSRRRQHRIYPHALDRYHFLLGKGMVSDDTEHACMVAQSLIVSGGDEKQFSHLLGWRLRWWLLGFPAGVGLATLRSIVKLWLGFPSSRSGVFSAGNGAAMRSAILGVCYGDDAEKLRALVRISTRITHTDPKAEYGALAVAIAAHTARTEAIVTPQVYRKNLAAVLDPEAIEFWRLIDRVIDSTNDGSIESLAADLGCSGGVSGYVYRTVPMVLRVWFEYPDRYREAITQIIRLGGDTDTTAAILGAIVGARVGKSGIPQRWQDDLWEWPRSIAWMERLGERLAQSIDTGRSQPALSLPILGVLARNLVFAIVVILHGFRRLLPPY